MSSWVEPRPNLDCGMCAPIISFSLEITLLDIGKFVCMMRWISILFIWINLIYSVCVCVCIFKYAYTYIYVEFERGRMQIIECNYIFSPSISICFKILICTRRMYIWERDNYYYFWIFRQNIIYEFKWESLYYCLKVKFAIFILKSLRSLGIMSWSGNGRVLQVHLI